MVYVVSDTHFAENPIYTDPYSIEQWNDVVRPGDTIIHLGDVAWGKKALDILKTLHGNKILILGNHDTLNMSIYTNYFQKVYQYYVVDDIIFSHQPIIWPINNPSEQDITYLETFRYHTIANTTIDTWNYRTWGRIRSTIGRNVYLNKVTLNIHGHFHEYGRSVFYSECDPHSYSQWNYFTIYNTPVPINSCIREARL